MRMSDNAIMGQIEALERVLRPEPLIVKAVDDGKEILIPARTAVDRGLDIQKVVSGNNLNDLDYMLEAVRQNAIKQKEE